MSTREDLGYDPVEKDPVGQVKKPSVTHRVKALLRATAPKWWSPYEVGKTLVARSAPRRMREIMEEDRGPDGRLRVYQEKSVPNVDESGSHKLYRWVGENNDPPLF